MGQFPSVVVSAHATAGLQFPMAVTTGGTGTASPHSTVASAGTLLLRTGFPATAASVGITQVQWHSCHCTLACPPQFSCGPAFAAQVCPATVFEWTPAVPQALPFFMMNFAVLPGAPQAQMGAEVPLHGSVFAHVPFALHPTDPAWLNESGQVNGLAGFCFCVMHTFTLPHVPPQSEPQAGVTVQLKQSACSTHVSPAGLLFCSPRKWCCRIKMAKQECGENDGEKPRRDQ